MITFNNIVERFKVFAENHFFVKSFSFGSPDDVDLSKFTNFPLMHLVYTGATYDAGTKTYNLEVYILDVPSDKNKKADRQKEVVSDAEQCAEDIIADIKNGGNIFLFAQDYEVVNATTTPLEEETKNVLSGVLLDLSVAIPYEWDACNAPIDGVEPGGTEVTYARRGVLRMLTLDGATDVPSVRTIKVTNGTLTDDGDGVVTLDTGGVDRLSQLEDTAIVTPEDRETLIYDGGQWVNDTLGKGDVGLANVDNTSDADKPVSTATQTALNAKADTSSVPTELNDLSDVTITGTPTGNQALIYDTATSSFKSTDSFTNRFEDDVERGSGNITPFVERAYGVKADGDGIFIDSQSDTPSAGKVIKRKIYHKAGLITDSDVIDDYTLIHTFDDDTAYSATESTFEGFRDGDTYGTPPYTLIQTWDEEDAAPSFTGLLNESYGSGAEAAYSTRRLNGNVTECMVIRRASDSTTQTIGFDSEGNIDESAIETFCTGTTCTVLTWKDQSGNGNDATAAASNNEPTIYTAGALVKENGRVAVDFDGNNDFLSLTGTTATNTVAQILVSVYDTSASSLKMPLGGVGFWQHYTSNQIRIRTSSGDLMYTTGLTNGNRFLGFLNGTGSGYTIHQNGTQKLTSASTSNWNLSEIGRGLSNNTYAFDNVIQEVILYNADKSSVRSDIESNIGDYFTQNTPLLDTYTGAAAAYSLRKLRTAYTGDAVEVYNGSSYADIGFNVFGELDTVALAAHCGSNDGFVSKWYDQSSNGNTATQTTTAAMPKIYDGTTGVVTENGKVALYFDSSWLLSSAEIMNVYPLMAFSIVKFTSVSGSRYFLDQSGTYGAGFRNSTSGDGLRVFYNYGAFGFLDTTTSVLNDQILTTARLVSSDQSLYINGVEEATNNTAFSGSGTSGIDFAIGTDTRDEVNRAFVGNIQEIIVYPSDQSSNRTNIEDNINTFYDIY